MVLPEAALKRTELTNGRLRPAIAANRQLRRETSSNVIIEGRLQLLEMMLAHARHGFREAGTDTSNVTQRSDCHVAIKHNLIATSTVLRG